MPVEIKELVIRAVVHQEGAKERGHGAAASGEGRESAEPEEHEALVAAAVREVLRILKSSKER
jgi:hypothetical protein